MRATFFRSAPQWRSWLVRNHATTSELWVGLHKKGSGKESITYPEAVDQALCFGWIDGLRKTIDESYRIRFTPRNPGSRWSRVNIKRMEALTRLGLVAPHGARVFASRDRRRPQYSYESTRRLDPVYEARLRKRRRAWTFFRPSQLGTAASWWIMSAQKDETRLRRLGALIRDSEEGVRLSWAR